MLNWMETNNNNVRTISCAIPESKAYLHVTIENPTGGHMWTMQCPELFCDGIEFEANDAHAVRAEAMRILHNIIFQRIRELQQCAQAVCSATSEGATL